ncbi:hypothetical protein [Tomitella biformata]|uniref:hypothetical protein n=1 Tax=Tomitella biformata TaxID=630403 RepID=UPI0004668CE0|nr:hypothetical protein [Tomitella biformata]
MKFGQEVWDRLVLALLIVDGAAVGILSVFFLPLTLGSVPFPISAFIAGGVNLLLVRTAARDTQQTMLIAAPLIAWGAVYLVFALGRIGGSGVVPGDWRGALLVFVGAMPAVMWLTTSAMGRAAARGTA